MPAFVPSLARPFAGVLAVAIGVFGGGAAARAVEPSALVKQFCQECHAGDRVEGDIDLAHLTPEAMRRDVATWQRATEMVVTGQMPPREAVQPTAEERTAPLSGGFSAPRPAPMPATRGGSCSAGSTTPNTRSRSAI